MQMKVFIGTDKAKVKSLVDAFIRGAKNLSILNVRNDMSYAKSPGKPKEYRATIYYTKGAI